ncbi:MAG: tetratricopeptide repeat protein [Lentisphaeria bacterium]
MFYSPAHSSKRKVFFALVLYITSSFVLSVHSGDTDTILSDVETAMRKADFEAALERLAQRPDHDTEESAYALYLKARAHFLLEEYKDAEAPLNTLIENYPNSDWYRKARFLKGTALARRRKFKEAETIYEDEVRRLLSSDRKEEIAGLLIELGDAFAKESEAQDLNAPSADYQKAYQLYSKALELAVGRDVRDDLMYKRARARQKTGDHNRAIKELQNYLEEFDPDWTGRMGTAARESGLQTENPEPAGKHRLHTRYRLAESQIEAGQSNIARIHLEDLLSILEEGQIKESGAESLKAEARWLLVQSYGFPDVALQNLDKAVDVVKTFLEHHPSDQQAVVAAYQLGEAYRRADRTEEAITAYNNFLDKKNYLMPEEQSLRETDIEPFGKTPVQLEDEWRKRALYHSGGMRYEQKEYDQAVSMWEKYTNKYPNGPDWSKCQRGIVDANYRKAVGHIAAENYREARDLFNAFLQNYPLDERAKTILFAFGQMAFIKADKLADNEELSQAEINSAYQQAIDKWDRLISKYPDSKEASLAQFRIGKIYEERLQDHEQALAAYEKLDWGPWAGDAQKRIAEMKGKHLRVTTPRKFRSDEKPAVEIDARNIEEVTLKQYFLNFESFFRKTHGTGQVNKLDIDLIEPDRTWDVSLSDYADYRPLQQTVDIPFSENKAGVCVVNVSSKELEASTLVIRSDLELILRSSRKEALVFVQNMLTSRPTEGARVLLSNGKEVFAKGTTNGDGIWRKEVKELEETENLRVFAVQDGHAAANDLNLQNIKTGEGLSPKGYIYADRSAYKPGQTVKFRGIIRSVENGSYAVPEDREYLVSITGPEQKTLWQKPMTLSDFGTFHTEFQLADEADVGRYTIKAQRKDESGESFAAEFKVKEFKLKKLRLTLEPERDVYFRGEQVDITARAEYYWGQPAVNKPVRYDLPDGRHFVEHTNDKGEFEITYDTSGTMPGRQLNFNVRLEGEDVTAGTSIYLAKEGFKLEVEPSRDVVLSGEPFDVRVHTMSPDDQPVGEEVTVQVLRRKTTRPDPVLQGIPWMQKEEKPAAEVKVAEHSVTTDADSGTGKARLKLEEGGVYILRVQGKDRFEQTITAENKVKISDEDDETKLRFFSDSDTLKVGEKANLRLHARVNSELALLTFEGDTVIDYRIIEVGEGFNQVPLVIDHKHFPNFRVAASLIDGRKLRTAHKPFEVKRELQVAIDPETRTLEPGEEGTVSVKVTDQLGRPVKAEFSLALIDEALFSQFPDKTPGIIDYFQKEARRYAEFRAVSSCGFSYQGETEDIESAYLEEAKRLEQEAEEQAQRTRLAEAREKKEAERPSRSKNVMADEMIAEAAPRPEEAGQRQDLDTEREKTRAMAGESRVAARRAPGDESKKAEDQTRREIPEAGHWLAAVVTDENGQAKVDLEMPEKTTEWRLTARGCTVDTLVGETTTDMVTRKKLFVNLKAPSFFREGDSVQIISRLHNLTDYSGDGELKLEIYDGADFDRKIVEKKEEVTVSEQGVEEVLFDGFDIPATQALKVRVNVVAGDYSDTLERVITVKPWGLEYADTAGGVAEGSEAATVMLPDDRSYRSRWMTVSVGPELKRSIVEMALDSGPRPLAERSARARIMPPPPGGMHLPGSDLSAAIAALQYAEQVNLARADVNQLADRARSLINTLIVSQENNNHWSWHKGNRKTDKLMVSALNFRALVKAKKHGINVDDQIIENAQNYLKDEFRNLNTTDTDGKAVVLHALSTTGAADFASLNRLHRDRNSLTTTALAYTALAFANVDRAPMANELLDILEEKVEVKDRNGHKSASWDASQGNHPWLKDDVETTALAALAFIRLRPQSSLIEQCANFLLQKRGVHGFGKARGAAVSAIAAYYGKAKYIQNDYRLAVEVNGQTVRELSSEQTDDTITFPVPDEALVKGENLVRFNLEGRGQYSYSVSLTGFSEELKDPNSWRHRPDPYARKYRHAPLTYRGRSIGVDSSSPVENIEIGQRVDVRVSIRGGSRDSYLVVEEPIPAGMRFVEGSLEAQRAAHHEIKDGRILLFYPPNQYIDDFGYELVGHTTGDYRILPTVIRDTMHPQQMRLGKMSELTVLAPGVDSPDEYKMNRYERFKLGKLYFEDGIYEKALPYLEHIFTNNLNTSSSFHERDVAKMLLWIYTSEGFYDAKKIVDAYEVLRERYPDLEIPFDKILIAGKAYRDLGEYERAYLIFRAIADAGFVKDSNISAVLEDQGQFFRSVDYQQRLWREYPDTAKVTSAYFTLSQTLYQKASDAPELAEKARRAHKRFTGEKNETEDNEEEYPDTEPEMLAEAEDILQKFLTLYPENPLADNAAFSMANVLLDLKQYDYLIRQCNSYKTRFPESKFTSSFQYMIALAHFWKQNYTEALAAAKAVAEGDSKDRDYARYIVAQIYHTHKKPSEAIAWYEKVADQYADAKQAIEYFRQQNMSLPEINIFRPDEETSLELTHRNIEEAEYQVYRVDLMKLYLREKSLSDITELHLAGIKPLAEQQVELSGNQQLRKQTTEVPLNLEDEGAYLVICRGDDLFCSGLVLVTPLKLEVQQDVASGRVRVNVLNTVSDDYVPEVHVKAIGSRNDEFRTGETDLRGLFVAENIQGKATVIARVNENQYAFFRGDKALQPEQPERGAEQRRQKGEQEPQQPDYQQNLRQQNMELQQQQYEQYDQMRRNKQEGVKIKKTQ